MFITVLWYVEKKVGINYPADIYRSKNILHVYNDFARYGQRTEQFCCSVFKTLISKKFTPQFAALFYDTSSHSGPPHI